MHTAPMRAAAEPLLDLEMRETERTVRPRGASAFFALLTGTGSCMHAQIAETAGLGDAILGALYHQRRRLDTAVNHRRELNSELDNSSTLMQRMSRRLSFRHMLWYAIVVVLVVAIITAIWWRATHGNSDSDKHDSGKS
mmetsp:Transcript_48186/g.125974  ORF Transcript_48186/g.125974 Transcript_48186/m.125974 type:complete len:139 (-) Transcript_48186:319-735(-)